MTLIKINHSYIRTTAKTMYAINKTNPPNWETPPLVKKRQKITVVTRRNGRISVKIAMSNPTGELTNTIPKTSVRLVRFDRSIEDKA